MRIVECEQGSREWVEARLGRPTASQFSRIITPGRMQLSAQRKKYQAELHYEWWCGEPKDDLTDNQWIDRGKALEPQARDYYSLVTDLDVETVGLLLTDDGIAGASPDGLMNNRRAGLELKVPMADTHLLWLSVGEVPTDYRTQVQGQIWVGGLEWVDFLSYCPELPPLLVRVEPDPAMQAAFDEHLPAFYAELLAGRQRLVDLGVKPWEKL